MIILLPELTSLVLVDASRQKEEFFDAMVRSGTDEVVIVVCVTVVAFVEDTDRLLLLSFFDA